MPTCPPSRHPVCQHARMQESAVMESNRLQTTTARPPLAGERADSSSPTIVTVAAAKGGVGKTTLAYELAYILDAPLIDLDWDRGGATRQWGYRPEARMGSPLLDALERGRTPKPIRARLKPDLVPCHPDFVANQPDPDAMAVALEQWAREWGRAYVVVDTHPGGVPATFGAMAAARVVVTPAVLATKELEALEGMLTEMPDYPLLVVPNKVPPVPPAAEIKRLGELVRAADVKVAPPISEYRWLMRRKLRRACSSYQPVPLRAQRLVDELHALAQAVKSYVPAV
jgi:chromosome partitioning protein